MIRVRVQVAVLKDALGRKDRLEKLESMSEKFDDSALKGLPAQVLKYPSTRTYQNSFETPNFQKGELGNGSAEKNAPRTERKIHRGTELSGNGGARNRSTERRSSCGSASPQIE